MKGAYRASLGTAAVALVLLGGCYSYVPTPLETVPVGTQVRAYLSPAGTASINERVGIDARTLSGRLEERNAQQAVFLVRSPQPIAPVGTTPLYQRVDVAVPDVLRVDVRVFHRARTGGLVVALLGAATVWAVRAFTGGQGGSQGQTPNPVE